MNIDSYDSLVRAAAAQEQPQRLLFAFAQAQREPGHEGATLTPVMCADKLPSELADFAALARESTAMPVEWDVVFVASLSGKDGQPPASKAADAPLRQMVTAIQTGQIATLLAFDKAGELLSFQR